TVVAVFLIGLGVVFVVSVLNDPPQTHGSLVGKRAPEFTVSNIQGDKPLTRASLGGKVAVVNFWNSWCIPCRQEHNALVEFYKRHRNDPDVEMVGIVRDDTESAVRSYVTRENMQWPVAMDPDGKAAIAYGTTGQPETYVISPSGVVSSQVIGPV